MPYLILLKTKPNDESVLIADKKAQNAEEPVDAKVDLLIEDIDDKEKKEIAMPEEPSFLKIIWVGCKNLNYVLLIIVYSLQIGVNTAFGINIDPIFGSEGLGFSSQNLAKLGICVVLMGVVSSMINGILLKRYR